MSRLRLVKVMPFFTPATQFGGVVTQAALVCGELAARGHAVRVVTTDNGVDAATPRDRWVDVHGGQPGRHRYRVYYASTRPWHRVVPYWSPGMRPALREALDDANVCCLNVGLTLANRLAGGLARQHNVPYVYNAEGALCPTRLAMKGWRKSAFLARVERPLLGAAAACQAVTAKEVDDLLRQGVGRARIHEIPNGVAAFVAGDAARFRHRFGIGEDQRIVLYCGRLHTVKGVDLLLDVFARSAPGDATLVIAGHDEDGTGRRAAMQVAADTRLAGRVVFTGHLQSDVRRDALTAAGLFVLFSHSEGLPNAVLEALAAGVPCLLTEPCNVPEVASAGAGMIRSTSVDPLGDAMRSMLVDAEGLRRMGGNARTLANERFAIGRVVDRLEALYSEVSAARAARAASTAGAGSGAASGP